MERWTYALLLAGSILIPLIRSFESRVAYYKKWRALFPALFVLMLVFIPWDIVFTRMGVWSFNYQYVLGYYAIHLPVEEWLFFIVIPFCCVFVYEVLVYFFPKFYFPRSSLWLSLILGGIALATAIYNMHRIYTFTVMSLSALLLFWQVFINTHKSWLSHFYLMYFISLIPFFMVNGVLTAFPVVIYDNTENLAIRMFTIPLEDSFYFLSMMFITMMVYEHLKKRFRVN